MLKAAARKAARTVTPAVPGGIRFARRLLRRSAVIVMYHGIVEQPLPVFNWCQLHRDEFERQIAFLSSEYRILPLEEVIAKLNHGSPLPERTVCITFDDGFRSVHRTAFPILLKHQAPATVFLVTSLIGSCQAPWPEQLYSRLVPTKLETILFEGQHIALTTNHDKAVAYDKMASHLKALSMEKKDALLAELMAQLGPPTTRNGDEMAMLNWEEVEKLNATGLMTFGSHTHTHQILARCSREIQHNELLASRNSILEHLGSAELFAYPNGRPGDYTAETKQLLMSLGYRCGLTTTRGVNPPGADVYELCRVGVGGDVSFTEFQVEMLGW